MEISVSDPEKHGTSTVNAFVDFRIRTTTKLPQFAADDFFVRRRYRDFVWLRQQLTSPQRNVSTGQVFCGLLLAAVAVL